jgi:hypothetical protein
VFNFTITHESRVGTLPEDMPEGQRDLLPEDRHDPANAKLPPYYPDTPVIRKHWAHYYDLITAMDAQVGQVLRELEEDGLADNTIVFWFSDHGVGLPRAKRWLYDAGLHVPMIVRWPGTVEPGSINDELVSFVDFAPTVLSLAGVTPPEHMQGQVILGENAAPPRKYIYGMRDRMDERYDHIRAVRDKRYKYIRNYEPWRAYDQPLRYPESFPVMQEMRRVQAAGELTPEQALFFRQEKLLEELYDMEADPHELNNLASDAALADKLDELRGALDAWEIEIDDLGPIPEFALADWLTGNTASDAPSDPPAVQIAGDQNLFGRTNEDWLTEFHNDDRRRRIAAAKSFSAGGAMWPFWGEPDPLVVYWGLESLAQPEHTISESSWERIAAFLDSEKIAHQLGAAGVCIAHDRADEAMPVVRALLAHENEFTRLYAAQLLEPIAESNAAAREALEAVSEDRSTYVRHTFERALMGAATP